MAFKPTGRAALPAPIPSLGDHPPYAELSRMDSAIAAVLRERQRQIELLLIEPLLHRTSVPGHIRDRAATLRAAAPTADAEGTAPAADAMPAEVVACLPLLRGGKVEETPGPAAMLKRLRIEEDRLEAARRALSQAMDLVRDEESLKVAKTLAPAHKEILRRVWAAAAELSAALDEERTHFAGPLIAGYAPRPDVLHRAGLDAGSRLGSLSEHDSQVSTFRRRLEMLGIL